MFFASCFVTCGVINATRLAHRVDRLVMTDLGIEGIATLYMPSGRDGNYKYEFREGMTGTFWNIDYKKIKASWREFSALAPRAKIAFLQKLTQTWLRLTEQPDNFVEFDYPEVETIHWHYEAVQYLLDRIRVNPDAKFSWLEKVALYAVTEHINMFTRQGG
jgi:hypothetical protein